MTQVRVRAWIAKQDKTEVDVDTTAILAEVVRIWKAIGVQLILPKAASGAELTAVPTDLDSINAERHVIDELCVPINKVIDAQGTDRHIDVVFVPTFGHWGKAYTPLTPAGGATTTASFAPFNGPVAIVATTATRTGDKKVLRRGDETWPLTADSAPAASSNPLIPTAIANDLAHEIGHLFGLWHTTQEGRPGSPAIKPAARQIQHLIHETVYNRIAKRHWEAQGRARTEDEARKLIAPAVGEQIAAELTLGWDNEWYVALRGEWVDPADWKVAEHNVTSGLYLRQ